MSHIFGILLAIVSIATTSKAIPDLHKHMSPQQLQSVFHVDDVAAVPHYEVIQLLHHSADAHVPGTARSAGHYRRRRSINGVAEPLPLPLKVSHHVKKDLSKNPYYSELKAEAANANAANANSIFDADKPVDLSTLKEHNVSFSAFGAHMNLTLRPTEGLFKGAPHALRMWTVNSEPNATHGLDLQELHDEDHKKREEIGEVFQDEANMAAILMRRHLETGDLMMDGSIGHDLVIKPVPHELSPNKEQTHHIIYKRDTSSLDHLGDFAFMEPDDLATSEKLERLQRRQRRSTPLNDFEDDIAEAVEDMVDAAETRTRAKRDAPYTIYPEVLVIIDYDGYRLHGGDNLQVKRYFISFWNGVDLRYRLLKGPKIRISIAGIIISRGRDATPYLERNRVGRDAIDSAAALTDMGKYLFRERRLPVYDIAVAITKYDMCRRRKGGRCTKGTAGFAYVGGACVVNKRLEKVNSVAIIEDTGGYSGIIVAAHEVGHLLGAVHDGSPPPSYLGGPGAQRCRWEDGYIMSDLRHTERGFRWSPCTVQSFHHFLNGDTATCLQNAPHEDGALGRSLPGTLMTLDAQCRRDRGTYACFKDERVCAQLFCFDAQTGYCVAYRPAAEGSICGNGMHCLDGRCAALPNRIAAPEYPLVYNASTGSNNNNNQRISDERIAALRAALINASVDIDRDDDNDEQQQERQQQSITGDDNVESNEAIELQKPTTIPLTTATGRNFALGNGRNGIALRGQNIIDAYFKKLQALNNASPPPSTATTAVSPSTTSVTATTAITKQQQHNQQQQQQQQQQSQDSFGSHFLKRTQSSSASSGSSSSSSGSNKSSNNKNSSSSRNSSNRSTSISSSNNQQTTTLTATTTTNNMKTPKTTTPLPAYVTNYIGDNTNNAPKILQHENQQQQQQQLSSTTGATVIQPKQIQKIRTQKLIRRQLLRTQIK